MVFLWRVRVWFIHVKAHKPHSSIGKLFETDDAGYDGALRNYTAKPCVCEIIRIVIIRQDE